MKLLGAIVQEHLEKNVSLTPDLEGRLSIASPLDPGMLELFWNGMKEKHQPQLQSGREPL